MTTTSHTSSAPAAHAAAPAQAAAQQRASGGPAAPADLFASLLALVADAPALATDATAPTAGGALAAAPDETDDPAADPLAALLAWVQPGLTPTAPGTASAASDGTAPSDGSAAAIALDTPTLTAETRRIDGSLSASKRPLSPPASR